MRIAIRHSTSYHFSESPTHGLQRLRLTPKHTSGQSIVDWKMKLRGARLEVEYDDHNCNHVTLVSVQPDVEELHIECSGVIETADQSGVIGRHAGSLPLWHFIVATPLTTPGPGIRKIVGELGRVEDKLDALHRVSEIVRDAIAYIPGATGVTTTAEEALAVAAGVCQDHAHAFIATARAIGVPARYVSGYLMMDDRVEQDAGHGWAEAHIDGLGWVGFDVSNGISPDSRYVRVATGRDYRDAAPVTGISYGGRERELRVSLAIERQMGEQQ